MLTMIRSDMEILTPLYPTCHKTSRSRIAIRHSSMMSMMSIANGTHMMCILVWKCPFIIEFAILSI